jgi:hypothetical protein
LGYQLDQFKFIDPSSGESYYAIQYKTNKFLVPLRSAAVGIGGNANSNATIHQNVIDNYNQNYNSTTTAMNTINNANAYLATSNHSAASTSHYLSGNKFSSLYHTTSSSNSNKNYLGSNINATNNYISGSSNSNSSNNVNEIIYIDTDSTDEQNNPKKRKIEGFSDDI